MEDHELRLVVHQFDGATVSGAGTVKLNKTRVDSIIYEMSALLAKLGFFKEAAIGINCSSSFICFSTEGVASLLKHSPEHRCRHVLKGKWYQQWALPLHDLFSTFNKANKTGNRYLLQ